MNWNNQITDLRQFYNSIDIPSEPIQLNEGEVIIDCFKFIKSHIGVVIANNGKERFQPYLDRLEKLRDVLTFVNK
tara:strand:+ start:950 stop:1174 length:225 start_codon:yes stop_codon:yes gene_type:complete